MNGIGRIGLVVVAGTCVGLAHAEPGSVPAEDAGLLGGPEISEKDGDAERATLVKKSYDGTLEPLEVPVAEAAVALLDLDETTAEKVQAVMAKRAAAWDAVVKANIKELTKIQGVQNLEAAERRKVLAEAAEILKPALERGPYEDEIAAVLPGDQREKFLAIVTEYQVEQRVARLEQAGGMGGPGGGEGMSDERRQRMIERLRSGGGERRGGRGGRGGGMAGGSLSGDARMEFKMSLERTLGSQQNSFENFLQALDLTPEQESNLRGLIAAGRSEGRDRSAMMREVMAILTPEQRAKARAYRENRGLESETE